MTERNERRRGRESRRQQERSREQRERSREQRRTRRESRTSATPQGTLATESGSNPAPQSGTPTQQGVQQGSAAQQPVAGTTAGQQLPGQQAQQPQQPVEQGGIAQQPTAQQLQQPNPQGFQQPTEQQQAGQQPAGQQPSGQQPAGQQPAFQQASNYTPQAPLAVGVPASGAQAFGGATQPQQFRARSAQPQSLGGTPSAGGYAGTMGGQLQSQPSEIYPEAFADHLTETARDCLDDCIDVSQVAAWCSDRCLEQGQGMAECSRLCNEAATLGGVAAEFIAKDSVNLPAIVDAYVDVAERAVDELGTFDAPHTNEAEMVIDRSIDSSLEMLNTV